MCSRYEIDIGWGKIAARYGIEGFPEDFKGGEIRPTDKVPVIALTGISNNLQWGIPAPWNDRPLINARAETLQQKPTFRPLLGNRCLVPATAYFEWRKAGGRRLKNRIGFKDRELMSFAGLFLGNHFTIITCEPSPSIAHIHNRMPVIIPRTEEARWCDRALPFHEIRPLLKPYDPASLVAVEDTPPLPKQPDLFG